MQNKTLARAYAKALSISDANILGRIDYFISNSNDAEKFLGHPLFSNEEKTAFVLKIAGENLPERLNKFIALLVKKKRIFLLKDIIDELEKLYSDSNNLKYVEVIAPSQLGSEQMDRLANALSKKLGCKINLNIRIEPDKIAGLIIKYGDVIIDNTVVSQMRHIKEYLLQRAG